MRLAAALPLLELKDTIQLAVSYLCVNVYVGGGEGGACMRMCVRLCVF